MFNGGSYLFNDIKNIIFKGINMFINSDFFSCFKGLVFIENNSVFNIERDLIDKIIYMFLSGNSIKYNN